MEPLNIHIISEDHVFITIIHRLLLNRFGLVNLKKSHSFSSVIYMDKSLNYEVILLDCSITGTAKFELISYLRNTLDVTAPILYFTNIRVDERGALEAGATDVVNKPIVPKELMDQISLLTTSTIK